VNLSISVASAGEARAHSGPGRDPPLQRWGRQPEVRNSSESLRYL
jgi:hypothetical protein